jgi:hypothetical protein
MIIFAEVRFTLLPVTSVNLTGMQYPVSRRSGIVINTSILTTAIQLIQAELSMSFKYMTVPSLTIPGNFATHTILQWGALVLLKFQDHVL